MQDTGERMIPELTGGGTFWEHVHRYRFAARRVVGKQVLDIACGEGYGTHALAMAGAANVIGVDVSEEACEHARSKYGIDARCGDAQAIPLAEASVDVVVSFETIEHVSNPAAFLDECLRILKPGGSLIISTPNEIIYKELCNNPFHCSEMDEEQFARLLTSKFVRIQWYVQSLTTSGWWAVRTITAAQSPWKQVRGYWRLALLCPHHDGDVPDKQRCDIAETILRPQGFLSAIMDPFRVRKRARWTKEQPTYIVAVAKKLHESLVKTCKYI